MSITSIATGLSGLKSAGEMIKALRDGLKSGSLKADEIYGRIGEIYDYIVDSKAALVDAQDEIQGLKKKIADADDEKAFRESMKFNKAGYYERGGSSGVERYCSSCLDEKHARIRLLGSDGELNCHVHGYRQFS